MSVDVSDMHWYIHSENAQHVERIYYVGPIMCAYNIAFATALENILLLKIKMTLIDLFLFNQNGLLNA